MPKLTKLGKYEIRRELGKGGMGIVYEGYDPYIERAVAIKTVRISSIDQSETEEAFRRFRREAQAAGRLSHPRIVSIYEYSEEQDIAFIAMELIDGKELKDYFDRKVRFSLADTIGITLQLLDALDYSHRQGVIHRDIKPANIFITAHQMVKVADFGIAKIESSHLTQTGSVLGTPSYMSPEQFHGDNIDRRSDIYSAGVILYQLLAGRRPFTGSMITIMHKVLNQTPEPPSSYNPEVPWVFDEVVARAMAKRPEDRFQSAAEFITAIKLAMKNTDVEQTISLSNPLAAATTDESDATLVIRPPAVSDKPAKTVAELPQDAGEAWASIRDSQDPAVFRQYLKQHPQAAFCELAQLRLKVLDQQSIHALKSDGLRELHVERKAAQERKQAAVRAQQQLEAEKRKRSAAGIIYRKEQENRTLRANRLAALQAKMTELRSEADVAKRKAEAARKQEAQEQVRRSKQVSVLMAERTRKISEIMAKREAEKEAQRKLEAENVTKLKRRLRLKRKAKPEE